MLTSESRMTWFAWPAGTACQKLFLRLNNIQKTQEKIIKSNAEEGQEGSLQRKFL